MAPDLADRPHGHARAARIECWPGCRSSCRSAAGLRLDPIARPKFGLVNLLFASLTVQGVGPSIFTASGASPGSIWRRRRWPTKSSCYRPSSSHQRRHRAGRRSLRRHRPQTITRITLPLLAPAILLATVISLVLSFESFEVELLLGQPVHLYVYSTRIYDLVNNQPSNVGEATAMAVCSWSGCWCSPGCTVRRSAAGRSRR